MCAKITYATFAITTDSMLIFQSVAASTHSICSSPNTHSSKLLETNLWHALSGDSTTSSKSFKRTQIKFSTPIPTNSCAKSPVEHLGETQNIERLLRRQVQRSIILTPSSL